MPSVSRNRTNIQDLDLGYHFSHYLGLIMRRIWFICTVGPLVTIAAMIGLMNVIAIDPPLRTRVLIGLDSPGDQPVHHNTYFIDPNRVELIRSRGFLAEIVEKLSLRFKPVKLARGEILDSVRIDSIAANGLYRVLFEEEEGGNFAVRYSTSGKPDCERIIETGSVASPEIDIPGIYLRFSNQFTNTAHSFAFEIIEKRKAIDALLENLDVTAPNPHQARNHISIAFQGRDYDLAATIANTIADEFVRLNLNFRRRRTSETLNALHAQLLQAHKQLNLSESDLRAFFSQNPTMGVDQSTRRTVAGLGNVESGISGDELYLREARRLHERFRNANEENRDQIVGEILVFLQDRNVPAAEVLRREYSELSREREELSRTYTSGHPMRLNYQTRLENVYSSSERALDEYLKDIREMVQAEKRRAENLSSRLRSLPSKELRLAQLERRHHIDSEIYGNILGRYNEARIQHAVEQADVYVMDYAVPPIAPPPLVKLFQLAVISLFLGTGMSIGPVVVFDLVDKSVRSVRQLGPMVSHPILGALPLIRLKSRGKFFRREKLGPDRGIQNIALENKAIPQYVKEMLRSIRTRLRHEMHEKNLRGFSITSLNPSEGKSLITVNLAASFARLGSRVLLIDADLRRGTVHRLLGLSQKPGLSDLVRSIKEKEKTALRLVDVIVRTHIPGLVCIPCGTCTEDSQEYLGSRTFARVVEIARERFDLILIDTPPLAVASDAAVVSERIGGVVTIVKAGTTNVKELMGVIAEFPNLETNMLGLILNQARQDRRLRYYRYSKYYAEAENSGESKKRKGGKKSVTARPENATNDQPAEKRSDCPAETTRA